MSWDHVGWAMEQELPAVEKMVLVAIANCISGESGEARISIGYIAGMAGVSARTAERKIRELEAESCEPRMVKVARSANRASSYTLPRVEDWIAERKDKKISRLAKGRQSDGASERRGVRATGRQNDGASENQATPSARRATPSGSRTNQVVDPGSRTEKIAPSPAASAAVSEQDPASTLAVIEFPVVGEDAEAHGRLYVVSEADLAGMMRDFPGVDALAELRKALRWCNDHPLRRKTWRGMPGFLSRWLERAQNQRARGGPRETNPPPRAGGGAQATRLMALERFRGGGPPAAPVAAPGERGKEASNGGDEGDHNLVTGGGGAGGAAGGAPGDSGVVPRSDRHRVLAPGGDGAGLPAER